jgi:molecular chaperone DnaK (HSP70)
MNFFIKKNVKLPYTHEDIVETAFDNQTGMTFAVYQGEKEFAKDNYFLNSFTIHGLRKAPAGDVKFNVKMELDENGILNVTANEINGTHYGGITIEGVNDLTKEQIEFFKNQEKELQKENKSK